MRDKLDWHAQAAIDAGQPEEHGFVHIACFLHWLAGRDWLEPSVFSKADRARIADGSIDLDDLVTLTDGQLAAEMATTEGAVFGAARYDAYLERWAVTSGALEPYTIAWTEETRATARASLDELYRGWKAEGGLKPAHGGVLLPRQHPEVEHLVPDRIGDQLLLVASFGPRAFGVEPSMPLLAGVDPAMVAIAHASHRFGSTARDACSIDVMVVPDRTAEELRLAGGGRPAWSVEPTGTRMVGDIEVGVGRFADSWMAWWFRDERLAQVTAHSRKRALALVALTDATMVAPVTVIPMTEEASPDEDGWRDAVADRVQHEAPDLEALLPAALCDGRGLVQSFGLSPEDWPLPPGATGGHLATTSHESGVTASILRVPGADRTMLEPLIDMSPEVPRKARRELRTIGQRDVAWFEARGAITAIWVQDDLLCTVVGYMGESVVLATIEQMP